MEQEIASFPSPILKVKAITFSIGDDCTIRPINDSLVHVEHSPGIILNIQKLFNQEKTPNQGTRYGSLCNSRHGTHYQLEGSDLNDKALSNDWSIKGFRRWRKIKAQRQHETMT
jgi:hypothetical protein